MSPPELWVWQRHARWVLAPRRWSASARTARSAWVHGAARVWEHSAQPVGSRPTPAPPRLVPRPDLARSEPRGAATRMYGFLDVSRPRLSAQSITRTSADCDVGQE